MSSLVSHSELKFLFDENVDKRLERFLKKNGVDVTSKPKGLSDRELAEFSISEKMVLVTNDDDFIDSEQFFREIIFSVIWLRIPQDKINSLLKTFTMLLERKSEVKDFKGNLIILKEEDFEVSPLP